MDDRESDARRREGVSKHEMELEKEERRIPMEEMRMDQYHEMEPIESDREME